MCCCCVEVLSTDLAVCPIHLILPGSLGSACKVTLVGSAYNIKHEHTHSSIKCHVMSIHNKGSIAVVLACGLWLLAVLQHACHC